MNRISVADTLRQAIELTIAHRRDLLRVGLVFIIGFFALGIVGVHYMMPMLTKAINAAKAAGTPPEIDPNFLPALFVVLILDVLLFTVFAVGWHRAVLIGPERGQGAQLSGRELRYFGRFWLCIVICIAIFFVIGFVEGRIGVLLRADPQTMIFGAQFACFLVFIYVFGRLGPSFVALSVGAPMTMYQSLVATKGNGLRILLINLLLGAGGLSLFMATAYVLGLLGLGELAPYTVLLIGTLIFCALVAVTISSNSIIFRQLTGWKTRG
jgi:hypothetical protein